MILVDTSVWITYFRGTDRKLILHLQSLLDEDSVTLGIPVKIEILGGSSTRDWPRLSRVLSALPVAVPVAETWARVERWIEIAVEAGERFGFADLLIAALAAERDMTLWSLDRDFHRLQQLGLVCLYVPA